MHTTWVEVERAALLHNARALKARVAPAAFMAVVKGNAYGHGLREVADALRAVLGVEVRVRSRGTGFRVELDFASLDEALALARRLRPPLAA